MELVCDGKEEDVKFVEAMGMMRRCVLLNRKQILLFIPWGTIVWTQNCWLMASMAVST